MEYVFIGVTLYALYVTIRVILACRRQAKQIRREDELSRVAYIKRIVNEEYRKTLEEPKEEPLGDEALVTCGICHIKFFAGTLMKSDTYGYVCLDCGRG